MSMDLQLGFEFRNRRYRDAQRGIDAWARKFDLAVERAGPVLSRELRSFLNSVADALIKRHGTAWPGGTTERSLSTRSGAALRSIRQSVRVTGTRLDDIEGEIGGSFYLRAHEYGAVIRARRVQYLTIPLRAALDSRGVPLRRRARDWDNTFVRRTKRGNLVIFRRQGKDLVPLYLLKKEVRIPPRLKMGETLDAGMTYFVDRATEAMFRALMED